MVEKRKREFQLVAVFIFIFCLCNWIFRTSSVAFCSFHSPTLHDSCTTIPQGLFRASIENRRLLISCNVSTNFAHRFNRIWDVLVCHKLANSYHLPHAEKYRKKAAGSLQVCLREWMLIPPKLPYRSSLVGFNVYSDSFSILLLLLD